MYIEEKQFKEFIIDSGLISRADISKASEYATEKNVSLADFLVSDGKITSDD